MNHNFERSKLTRLTLLAGLSLSAQQVAAVGLMLNPTSHLTGIANAGSAVYDHSIAAVSNNPAAMSLMSHKQIGGNFSLVIPDWSVDERWDCGAEGNCAKSNVAPLTAIPTFGVIRPMDNEFTWGLGMGAVAGAGLDYGQSWGGRAIVTENKLQIAELVNSISWRMNDQWTFGAGIGVIHGTFSQSQDLPSISEMDVDNLGSLVSLAQDLNNCGSLPLLQQKACIESAMAGSDFDSDQLASTVDSLTRYADGESGTIVELEGSDIGAKISVGTTFEFLPGHRIGAVYQYLSDLTFEGTATISGQLLSDEESQKPYATLTWNMPDRLIVSGSHQVQDNVHLYWDIERVFYSTFDSTDLRMDGYPVLKIDRNFNDANRYAIGGEYGLNDKLTLQLGFSYDESPVDQADRMPDVPVDDIFKTAFGAIYQVNESLNVHGYLSLEFLGDAPIDQLASIDGHKLGENFKLTNDTTLYVIGASFGYRF